MILEAGYEGFTMFELGKVGIFVAIAGILLSVRFFLKAFAGCSYGCGKAR